MFSLKSWMRRWLKPSATHRSARKSNRVRLSLEALDQRIVPAIISNGVVEVGIHTSADLNVPGGDPSSELHNTYVGLRYVPTNAEATADGCLCEGWGIADPTSGRSGYANESADGGANNLTPLGDALTSSTYVTTNAVTTIPGLTVTHDYHPSSQTPNLYEVTVTIDNSGPGATDIPDLVYRRVMDWDIEPTAFNEFVTLQGWGTTDVLKYTSDNGFASANPLVNPGTLSAPINENFTDSGPADHGAVFDFDLGPLAAGAKTSFNIYYGAAGNEADMLSALDAVNAKVYSLGEPNTPDGPTLGTPNTFAFAFGNLRSGGVNQAPTAAPDSLSTAVNTPVTVSSASLLSNDTDPDGDTLTLTAVSATSANGGTVALDPATRDVTYTPATGFSGTDTFTYTASDGLATSTGTVTVTVGSKLSQSIDFGPIPDKTYGDSPFPISATASSGLPVGFSIVSGPATYDPATGKVTLTGAGAVTIEASQAGDSTYDAATPVDQTFNVAKATPTVTVTGGNFTYDGLEHAVTGSIAGVNDEDLGTPTFSYSHTDASGNVVTTTSPPVGPGLYTVTASFAGDDNYESGSATATITISFGARSLTDLKGPFHAGRTIPIKIQLTDAAGNNVSSSSIDVTAFRLEQVNADGTTTPATVQDSGNANPHNLFRYDASLGGYIFNLSTKGLKAGRYNFYWTAGTDPTEHELSFTLV
ncbi:MAG TPA: Ig-like domain-containing protein [Gemmataceae bacterium]|jgi:hypothetical protein